MGHLARAGWAQVEWDRKCGEVWTSHTWGRPDALHDAPFSTSACSASIVSAPSESRIPPGVQHHPGGGNVAELGTDGWPPVGAPSTRVSSRDALWPVRSTLDSRIVRMTSAPSAADKAARFGRGVAPRGVLRGFGLFCFPPRLRSAILRPVCCAPVRLAIITPDARPPRESRATRGRASSPGGRSCCAVLAVTAAEHVVAVSRCLRERERTVGAVRQVGSDCPPAGIDSRPAFDLAGESLEACRPIDRRPAGSNGSVMLLSPHLYRDGKAGLVGAGGDGAPCIRRCEGARGISGRTRLGARDENASACEAQDRQRQHRLQPHDAPLMASGCLRARPWAPPSHHRL